MLAPMVEVYGKENFRKIWMAWIDCIVNANGGTLIPETELNKIKCPTLVIHGNRDPIVGIEHFEYLLKNIKNSQ